MARGHDGKRPRQRPAAREVRDAFERAGERGALDPEREVGHALLVGLHLVRQADVAVRGDSAVDAELAVEADLAPAVAHVGADDPRAVLLDALGRVGGHEPVDVGRLPRAERVVGPAGRRGVRAAHGVPADLVFLGHLDRAREADLVEVPLVRAVVPLVVVAVGMELHVGSVGRLAAREVEVSAGRVAGDVAVRVGGVGRAPDPELPLRVPVPRRAGPLRVDAGVVSRRRRRRGAVHAGRLAQSEHGLVRGVEAVHVPLADRVDAAGVGVPDLGGRPEVVPGPEVRSRRRPAAADVEALAVAVRAGVRDLPRPAEKVPAVLEAASVLAGGDVSGACSAGVEGGPLVVPVRAGIVAARMDPDVAIFPVVPVPAGVLADGYVVEARGQAEAVAGRAGLAAEEEVLALVLEVEQGRRVPSSVPAAEVLVAQRPAVVLGHAPLAPILQARVAVY